MDFAEVTLVSQNFNNPPGFPTQLRPQHWNGHCHTRLCQGIQHHSVWPLSGKKSLNYGINSNIDSWIQSFIKGCTPHILVDGRVQKSLECHKQQSLVHSCSYFTPMTSLSVFRRGWLPLLQDHQKCGRSNITTGRPEEFKTVVCLVGYEPKQQQVWSYTHLQKTKEDHLYVLHQWRHPKKVEKTTDLEVNITNDLSWSTHTSIIAFPSLQYGVPLRNLCHCPKAMKEQAYFTLVCSIVEYSAAVWGCHLKKDQLQLEQVQWCLACFVTGDTTCTSNFVTMLKGLCWNSLVENARKMAAPYKAGPTWTPCETQDICRLLWMYKVGNMHTSLWAFRVQRYELG